MKDGIPVMLGYIAVSFTFGMMAVEKRYGLSIWEAVLISLTNVTSAGQFAGLGIIRAGGSYLEMALTQLVINLRYSLMSFSLSQKLRSGTGNGKRMLLAFGVTDEIFGLSAAREGKLDIRYSYGVIAVAIPGWIVGTLLGGISGSVLPEFVISALSVAIYGMFLAIIIPPARDHRPVFLVVLTAMLLSTAFALLPVLKNISSGFTVILITVAVSALAAWRFPIPMDESEGGTADA